MKIKLLKKKEIKNLSFLILIILIIFKFFNTPYNIYSLQNWDYEKRMKQAYGMCQNESWGFYSLVINKFNLKNEDIRIFNDEGHVTLENLFNIKRTSNNNSKYLIILNFQSKNYEDIYNWKHQFIKKYKIKYRYNNCYLLELND